MKYDITKNKAPEMPNLGKGTECIKLLLSQASKDMHEPLVPMLFPSLGAHISGAEFQYPDRSWKEMCGLMTQLVGDSGCNKGQLTDLTVTCSDASQPPFRCFLRGVRKHSFDRCKASAWGVDDVRTPRPRHFYHRRLYMSQIKWGNSLAVSEKKRNFAV
jgi:hypothetical protein